MENCTIYENVTVAICNLKIYFARFVTVNMTIGN